MNGSLALAAPWVLLSMASSAQDPPAAAQVGYDEGFFLRSADGRAELTIEGLFQFDANFFDEERDPGSDFDVKRMRLEFGARFDSLRMHLEPNFLPDGTEMEEAWLGFDLLEGDARLMLGRMKVPFNLEEVRSRRWIDFPRFSILNQFAPAEDEGVFVNGKASSGAWEYGLAAYNGTGDSDTNSSKDLAARAMWHPFAGKSDSALENFQVGLAATIGNQDTDVGGDAIENEIGLPVITFEPGAGLDGDRRRVGLELAWYRGPWFAQAEAMSIAQDMSNGGGEEEIDFRGAYVNVSRVLTGESKSFAGVRPDSPFDPTLGTGRGAWILAARYSVLESDDDLASLGLATPGTFTDRIQTASIGLNWVLNEHAMVRNAFVHTWYSDSVQLDDGSARDEDAVLIEFQLSF